MSLMKALQKLIIATSEYSRKHSEMQLALQEANARIDALQRLVLDRTTVHMDVSASPRDKNVVILVGRYDRRDYIRCYSFSSERFEDMVRQMHLAARDGVVGRIDAPPAFEAVIRHEHRL